MCVCLTGEVARRVLRPTHHHPASSLSLALSLSCARSRSRSLVRYSLPGVLPLFCYSKVGRPAQGLRVDRLRQGAVQDQGRLCGGAAVAVGGAEAKPGSGEADGLLALGGEALAAFVLPHAPFYCARAVGRYVHLNVWEEGRGCFLTDKVPWMNLSSDGCLLKSGLRCVHTYPVERMFLLVSCLRNGEWFLGGRSQVSLKPTGLE